MSGLHPRWEDCSPVLNLGADCKLLISTLAPDRGSQGEDGRKSLQHTRPGRLAGEKEDKSQRGLSEPQWGKPGPAIHGL